MTNGFKMDRIIKNIYLDLSSCAIYIDCPPLNPMELSGYIADFKLRYENKRNDRPK